MTKSELFYMIEIHKDFEFTYNGKSYTLTYDKGDDGEYKIIFGQTFEGKKYSSLGEFMNTAKVENSYLKDMLDIL